MQVGTSDQTVEVTASNPLVDTTGSSLGEVLNEHDVQSLPLNGRIFSQLIVTVPGAVSSGWSSAPEAAAGAGAQTAITASVNGLPWAGTTYTLDGVSDMELLNAFETVTPPLDALQEVKASTANSDATVGVYGGAQVNAVVKSGTNRFHGSAYEFFRDDSLNAIQWHATSKAPGSGQPVRWVVRWPNHPEQGVLLRRLPGPSAEQRRLLHRIHGADGPDEAGIFPHQPVPSDL